MAVARKNTGTKTTTRGRKTTGNKEQSPANAPGVVANARPGTRKYNWEQAEDMYVNGIVRTSGEVHYPTQKELGEVLGIPVQRVRERRSQERWGPKKQAGLLKLAQERETERRKKLAEESVEFDSNALTAAKLGMAAVTQRLAHIARATQNWERAQPEIEARKQAGLEVDRKMNMHPVYHVEMMNLANALQTFHNIGQRALGTDTQKIEVSGPDGGPIEHEHDVVEEMQRTDGDRLERLLAAMVQIGIPVGVQQEEQEIVDAVVVETEQEEEKEDVETQPQKELEAPKPEQPQQEQRRRRVF